MFSFRDASSVLGVECQMGNSSILIQGAAIDTRKLEPGNLFVAIKTNSDDGHHYLEDAFLKGASGALIDQDYFSLHRLKFQSNPTVFQNLLPVLQPSQAFSQLATWYRDSQSMKAIAITGSVGKTSTKEFLAHLLRHKSPTLSTEGNLNNQLGLPMTLFRRQTAHRFCVAELGANHSGDIRELCAILKPDLGMITQIAPAHLKGFGTLRGVYDAKCELMQALAQGAAMILPEHDNVLIARAKKLRLKVITVGYSMMADYQISDAQREGKWISFWLNHSRKFYFPGIATFLSINAAMAVAAAEALGLPIGEMPEKWEGLEMPQGRFQERLYANDIRVIDDSYNASPSSFRRSLEAFAAMPDRRRKIVVIADMLELGDEEKKFHEVLGRCIGSHSFDVVVAYGPLSKSTVDILDSEFKGKVRTAYFQGREQAADFLLGQVQSSDDILLKASRGMSMDKVLRVFEEKFGPPFNQA
ncbi:MAG: UDP-N-acetylmuramoyl-tripeptide--D-alanyl-D-alanine ligase [Candidatus Omnitrophica bacterium]|nr:UDP-N-acetylmuramoyl-tripeptide--D-alanyl-D-alanine ligase [Candidatus Omnitrophota bacterium]